MSRVHLGTAALIVMAVAAAPAAAQVRRHDPSQYGYGTSSSVAFDNGYREGLDDGREDASRNRGFDYNDSSDYRRADRGYNSRFGDRDLYRREFRRGFEVGYRDGYGNNSWNGYGNRGNGRGYGYGNRGRYDYPGRYGYPGSSGYPGRYVSPAFQNGLSDGYSKGLEDVRDRDRYDPSRHKWYRSGDRHYNSRYGSKDLYRDEYRRGFQQGYDRAFRESGGYYRY